MCRTEYAEQGGRSRKPHRRLVRSGVVGRFGANHRSENEIRAAVNWNMDRKRSVTERVLSPSPPGSATGSARVTGTKSRRDTGCPSPAWRLWPSNGVVGLPGRDRGLVLPFIREKDSLRLTLGGPDA